MEIVKGSAQSALNPSHSFDCYFCSRRWTINFGSWVFHPSFLRPYVIALTKNTGDPKKLSGSRITPIQEGTGLRRRPAGPVQKPANEKMGHGGHDAVRRGA